MNPILKYKLVSITNIVKKIKAILNLHLDLIPVINTVIKSISKGKYYYLAHISWVITDWRKPIRNSNSAETVTVNETETMEWHWFAFSVCFFIPPLTPAPMSCHLQCVVEFLSEKTNWIWDQANRKSSSVSWQLLHWLFGDLSVALNLRMSF